MDYVLNSTVRTVRRYVIDGFGVCAVVVQVGADILHWLRIPPTMVASVQEIVLNDAIPGHFFWTPDFEVVLRLPD